MKDRIKAAAERTWEAIAPDILTSVEMNTGASEVAQADVVELVLDSISSHGNDAEAAGELANMDREAQLSLLNKVFGLDTYGW